MSTREPAVAGTFYPADSASLAKIVDRLVGEVTVGNDDQLGWGYIVPHAGYRYSGPIAAQVYARLRAHAARVRRVVLVGPAHRVPLEGCAATGAELWRTPLGDVPVDTVGVRALAAAGLVAVDDRPHEPEHSLEVQVPFLQRVLDQTVPIVPICVGQARAERVAAVVEAASRDDGTVVLCSTDLSHYLPDEQARERDGRTAEAIMTLSDDRIGGYDACGSFALRGLLRWAARTGLRPVPLALGNSSDASGDPERVVGYSAFALIKS